MGLKMGLFWKKGSLKIVFSVGTETKQFTGVSEIGQSRKKGIGALFGLIFPPPAKP
jgi:hypothetical protein